MQIEVLNLYDLYWIIIIAFSVIVFGGFSIFLFIVRDKDFLKKEEEGGWTLRFQLKSTCWGKNVVICYLIFMDGPSKKLRPGSKVGDEWLWSGFTTHSETLSTESDLPSLFAHNEVQDLYEFAIQFSFFLWSIFLYVSNPNNS